MIHREGIYKSYGERKILQNINLTIEAGSCYCLLGKRSREKYIVKYYLLFD